MGGILFPSEGGVAWVFRGISQGRSPREIPRKTQATLTSDGKSNILSPIHILTQECMSLVLALGHTPRVNPRDMPLGQHASLDSDPTFVE